MGRNYKHVDTEIGWIRSSLTHSCLIFSPKSFMHGYVQRLSPHLDFLLFTPISVGSLPISV